MCPLSQYIHAQNYHFVFSKIQNNWPKLFRYLHRTIPIKSSANKMHSIRLKGALKANIFYGYLRNHLQHNSHMQAPLYSAVAYKRFHLMLEFMSGIQHKLNMSINLLKAALCGFQSHSTNIPLSMGFDVVKWNWYRYRCCAFDICNRI